MKRIGKFEIIDHGIEHSQYFQGCGVALTSLKNVVTGIGDNPAEAIDDCLGQVAQAGFETEGMVSRIMAQKEWEAIPTTPNVLIDGVGNFISDIEELFYHISILWNEEENK